MTQQPRLPLSYDLDLESLITFIQRGTDEAIFYAAWQHIKTHGQSWVDEVLRYSVLTHPRGVVVRYRPVWSSCQELLCVVDGRVWHVETRQGFALRTWCVKYRASVSFSKSDTRYQHDLILREHGSTLAEARERFTARFGAEVEP